MTIAQQDLISVIVPVYNMEKYLHECVASLRGQSYQRLEILLIDDGSRDASGKLCDDYASIDGRIRVIHQENKGLSAARNVGLREARGAYLAFVDADDYVEPQYIEKLYQACLQGQVPLSCCNHWICEASARRLRFPNAKSAAVYTAEEACASLLCRSDMGSSRHPSAATLGMSLFQQMCQLIAVPGMHRICASEHPRRSRDLTWETSTMTDLGIDLSLFGCINITADWYRKITDDE